MVVLSLELCAALASTTCVLGQRFPVFKSLMSPKHMADIDPQNKYHPTATPKVFTLVLLCCWGFGSHAHESKVPRLQIIKPKEITSKIASVAVVNVVCTEPI